MFVDQDDDDGDDDDFIPESLAEFVAQANNTLETKRLEFWNELAPVDTALAAMDKTDNEGYIYRRNGLYSDDPMDLMVLESGPSDCGSFGLLNHDNMRTLDVPVPGSVSNTSIVEHDLISYLTDEDTTYSQSSDEPACARIVVEGAGSAWRGTFRERRPSTGEEIVPPTTPRTRSTVTFYPSEPRVILRDPRTRPYDCSASSPDGSRQIAL
jgi:hypothetical protein